jgi:spermidine/putrescine transport system substrate-binding protein
MNNDFKAGNIWITYAWPNDWKAMKDAGLQVSYMDPKEGRLGWCCGFVMIKGTPRRKLCHDYINAFLDPASCSNLSNAYNYGCSNSTVTNVPPDLATVGLASTDSIRKAHLEEFIPNRRRYDQIWSEVKAS